MNGKPPDPIDTAIAAAAAPVSWQQVNTRLSMSSGRYIELGLPADISTSELCEAIDGLLHFAQQVHQRKARILVPS